jgi:5-formyltetrahydrofolate cyclo-ligase
MAAPLSSTSDPPALAAAKARLRAASLAARAALRNPDAAGALADIVTRHCPPPSGALVAGFWPMGDEIDIRPLLRRLAEAGHQLALPVTPPRGQPLVFRRWAWGEALQPGRFGTSVPPDTAETVTPTALLVPLLAFDSRGRRLGYGGGYYDRTLAGLPCAWAVGVAFAGQQVALVPAGAHDVPLHGIATEAGFLRTER